MISCGKLLKTVTVFGMNQCFRQSVFVCSLMNVLNEICGWVVVCFVSVWTPRRLFGQWRCVITVELAPSGFDVKSFPRQSRSCGGEIATLYKSTLGSNITFKTNFDFTQTSFEVVQASITLQHKTLHFFLSVPPSTKPMKQSY